MFEGVERGRWPRQAAGGLPDMRYLAVAMVFVLLPACATVRAFARSGHAGVEAQLVALAVDSLTLDEQPSQGPFCDPTFTTCPDKAPRP